MNSTAIPTTVLDAFRRKCKSAILMNYVGDRFQIWSDWEDFGNQGRIYIFSTSISDDTQKALRELRKLVRVGLLTEDKKSYQSEMCRFRLAEQGLERRLLQEAYKYWRSFGYSVDEITERKH